MTIKQTNKALNECSLSYWPERIQADHAPKYNWFRITVWAGCALFCGAFWGVVLAVAL